MDLDARIEPRIYDLVEKLQYNLILNRNRAGWGGLLLSLRLALLFKIIKEST